MCMSSLGGITRCHHAAKGKLFMYMSTLGVITGNHHVAKAKLFICMPSLGGIKSWQYTSYWVTLEKAIFILFMTNFKI